MFEHVLRILLPVVIVMILLAAIVITVREVGAVVMHCKTPKDLMRMACCIKQHHDQHEESMGADQGHFGGDW